MRELFVELYRLVWSPQLGVPADETPDLQLREHRGAFGEPIGHDEQGMTFAELSFRTKPVAFMDAVVRQLLALGVRPGEVAL